MAPWKPKNTREHIILELKRAGSLTTKELTNILHISHTAVRQVLNALQAEGLVSARTEKQPQGRPRYVYSLTQKGHELFPDAYDTLAVELLETVRQIGGKEMVQSVVEAHVRRKEARYRQLMAEARSLADKLMQLGHLRDNEGYMAEVSTHHEKGTLVLREYNCPILRIAKAHPEMCAHEMALMERLLGTSLARTQHILAGEHCCCFEVHVEGSTPESSSSQ